MCPAFDEIFVSPNRDTKKDERVNETRHDSVACVSPSDTERDQRKMTRSSLCNSLEINIFTPNEDTYLRDSLDNFHYKFFLSIEFECSILYSNHIL